MYNLSGIVYRIKSDVVIIVVLALIGLLISNFWNKKKIDKKALFLSGFGFLFAIVMLLFYGSILINPQIDCYEGIFREQNRNYARKSVINYYFIDEENPDPEFQLDVVSKKEIFDKQFIEGNEYRVYFEHYTKTIVKVEEIQKNNTQSKLNE